MYHRSLAEIMSQPPSDQQEYDPIYNFAVEKPLRGTHAYAHNSKQHASATNFMPWSSNEPYQLQHDSRIEQRAHNSSMVTAAQWHTQPDCQTHPYANEQFVAADTSWPASTLSNTSYPNGAGYPPAHHGTHQQVLAGVSPELAQHTNKIPVSSAVAGRANHAVYWNGNPSEYQSTRIENEDAKMSKSPSPFSRMRKRGLSPRKPGKFSVDAILNEDPSITVNPTSHAGQSVYHCLLAQAPNSSSTAKKKQETVNSISGELLRKEDNAAIPVGRIDQSFQNDAVPKTKRDSITEAEEKPAIPLLLRETDDVSKRNAVVSNDLREAKSSCAIFSLKDSGDVPLGGKPREVRLKEEPSLRRKTTPQYASDIFSTIPLKKSKHATQSEIRTRKGGKATIKEKRSPKSKVAKPMKLTTKRKQGRRKFASFTLLEHSGDESDADKGRMVSSEADTVHPCKQTTAPLSYSDDEDFEDVGSRSKKKRSKVKRDSTRDEDRFDGVERTHPSLKKGRENREGTRKSARLSKRKRTTESEHEPNVAKKRKEVCKNGRSAKAPSKCIDELSDASRTHSESSDSDGDFVPTSQREQRFAAMKAKWEASKREPQTSTLKKCAKRTPKQTTTKRKRVNAKSNTSDGDKTDSRVDGQTSDSDSQNPSQRGSQPLDVKITSLSTRKRRKKVDYEDERKRLTEDELSTIRLAFVAHYPPPPSNAQAQGRFEMRYGREMSQAMIQGLWEKELKSWSERWWYLYMAFNDLVRAKKLEKPVDRKPTMTKKEVEGLAKFFYNENGDARAPPTESKPDKGKSSSLPSQNANDSKDQNDIRSGEKDSKATEGGSGTSPSKVDVNSPKLTSDCTNAAPDTDTASDHPSGTQTGKDSKVAGTKKKADKTSLASSPNEELPSLTGRNVVLDAKKRE